MSRRQDSQTWAIYCRSFLVTVGIAIGGFAMLLNVGFPGFSEPGIVYVALYALATSIVLVGLLASTRFMLGVAEAVGHDPLSILLLVVAFPVYLVIRPFYRSRP